MFLGRWILVTFVGCVMRAHRKKKIRKQKEEDALSKTCKTINSPFYTWGFPFSNDQVPNPSPSLGFQKPNTGFRQILTPPILSGRPLFQYNLILIPLCWPWSFSQ
jgi:hypothetical protein